MTAVETGVGVIAAVGVGRRRAGVLFASQPQTMRVTISRRIDSVDFMRSVYSFTDELHRETHPSLSQPSLCLYMFRQKSAP